MIWALICLLIEVFIFNFRFWESLKFTAPDSFAVNYDTSFQKNDDGEYVSSAEMLTVSLTDLHEQIDNLYIGNTYGASVIRIYWV